MCFCAPNHNGGKRRLTRECASGGNSYSLDGSSDLNTGSVATFSGCPFAPNTASVQWGGFLVPRWPNGTVIHNIYPVLYISASHYGNSDTECDLLLNGSKTASSPGVGIFSVPSSADSMGNTGAVITSASFGVQLVARGGGPRWRSKRLNFDCSSGIGHIRIDTGKLRCGVGMGERGQYQTFRFVRIFIQWLMS